MAQELTRAAEVSLSLHGVQGAHAELIASSFPEANNGSLGTILLVSQAQLPPGAGTSTYPVYVGARPLASRPDWDHWAPKSGIGGLLRVVSRGRAVLAERAAAAVRISQLESQVRNQSIQLRQHEIASRHFEAMFNGLPVPCFTFDSDGIVFEWNKQAETTFGIAGPMAVQRHAGELFGDEWCWRVANADSLASQDPNRLPSFDWSFDRHDGREVYLASQVIRLQGATPDAQASICASIDVTERVLASDRIQSLVITLEQERSALELANGRLSRMATTDGLTGLWNHRQFREQLRLIAQDADQTGRHLSLLLVDIDHFKSLNDHFGHPVGDRVLTEFARVLRRHETISVLPCRYGGEEFAIILTDCDERNGLAVAERVRQSIVDTPWEHRRVTASFGVAEYQGPDGIERLIEQADQALYAAKTAGRNRCCAYSRIVGRKAA